MTRNTMILHREWNCFLNFLSNEELGLWLRSLLHLMETGELPTTLERPVEVAFFAAYERVERDWQKLDKRLANLVQNRSQDSAALADTPCSPSPQKISQTDSTQNQASQHTEPQNKPSITASSKNEQPQSPSSQNLPPQNDCAVLNVGASSANPPASSSLKSNSSPLSALEQMTQACSLCFEHPPKTMRRELLQAIAQFGPEVTQQILNNCIAHHPKSWAYLRQAFFNASQMGISTPQDYQLSCLRASGQVVDRSAYNPTDIFAQALHRPLRLKRPA